MKTYRIANKNARKYVEEKLQFKGSHLYAKWKSPNCYVVYSYGEHFPLFFYSGLTNKWYKNIYRYSVSTSRHKSQCCPFNISEIADRDTEQLKSIISLTIEQDLDNAIKPKSKYADFVKMQTNFI